MSARIYALLWVLCLGLIACTNPAVGQDKEKSPFAGKYEGEWTFKSSTPLIANQTGKFTLSISASGKVTGKETAAIGPQGDITGSIDEDGDFKGTIEYPDNTCTLKGTVNKTKRGHLKGTMTQYFGNDNPLGTFRFDIPPK